MRASLLPFLPGVLLACSGSVATAPGGASDAGHASDGGHPHDAGPGGPDAPIQEASPPPSADAGDVGDGAPFTLVTLGMQDTPNDMVLSGPLLYISVDPDSIVTVPKAGGSESTLVATPANGGGLYQGLLTLANDELYWVDMRGDTFQETGIVSAPLSGGVPTVVATVDTLWIGGLVTGASDAYFIDQDKKSLDTVPLNGGSISTLGSLPDDAAGLLGQDELFFFTDPGGDVYTVPDIGGTPSKISTGPGIPANTEYADFPAWTAADSDYLYYSICSNNGPGSQNVVRLSLQGGKPEVLSSMCARQLVIDETAVYWNDGSGIYAVPKAGGTTVTIASEMNITAGPVVDDQAVYWGISINTTTCGVCPPPPANQANTVRKAKKPSF